jgi:excisionase family DNA binding protein
MADRRNTIKEPTGLTNPKELPYLLTASDAAELLRTTRKAIYAMAARGLLPGITRIGRRLLIRRDDVLEWLDRSRAPSSKEV